MANKLSYSKISSYSVCGERYRLHYQERLRDRWQRSSLLFGSAIDDGLNALLDTKDVAKATDAFNKKWEFNFVEKQPEPVLLRTFPDIVYSNSDLDTDLLTLLPEEKEWINAFQEHKKTCEWKDIPVVDRSKYNAYCWDCLKVKGEVIIRDYATKVLPQFLEVKAIQFKTEMTNSDGDSVLQVLDFVAVMQDGSVILFDNKTTSSLSYYEDDAPGTSQQLISYYYNNKEKFGLTAVGYVAIQKTLIKNKSKVCSKCGHDGSESRAKSCDKEYPGMVVKRGKEVEGMVRCDGEWNVTLNPEAAIKLIINPVSDAAIDLVLSTFDEANHGIKNGAWYKNLTVCGNIYGSRCTFFDHCWKGKDDELMKLPERKEKQ